MSATADSTSPQVVRNFMLACMEMRLRPARLRPARLRPARLRPARRAGPTTDTRRQTHSRSRGRQPHPHRQLQHPLRGHRRIKRTPRRGECRTHPITGVLEQPAPMRLDRPGEDLVVCGQRHPHRIRVGLPPTGRTLNIGEQKRHHPRRSSRRISGHPSRISQQTRSYLTHRRNPARVGWPAVTRYRRERKWAGCVR
jgi:hypothetical protein